MKAEGGVTYHLGMEWMNSCHLGWDETQNKSYVRKQDVRDARIISVP